MDILTMKKMSVAMDDPVEIWDVRIKNDSDWTRKISVFSYLEMTWLVKKNPAGNRKIQWSYDGGI